MSTLKVNNITDLSDDAIVTDGVIPAYPGQILQTITVDRLDEFSTSSTSYVDITDMSISITPTYASSKLLLLCNAGNILNTTTGSSSYLAFSGTTTTPFSSARNQTSGSNENLTLTMIDLPNSTSTQTYTVQTKATSGAARIFAMNFTVLEVAQ